MSENADAQGDAGVTVEEIRAHGRHDERGRFLPGNAARFTHGLRTRNGDIPAALTDLHRERVEELERDLGGDLGAVQRSTAAEWARLSLLAEALGRNLMEKGTPTGKGKTGAATSCYLSVVDRLHRFSTLLGLERKTKRVSLGEYIEKRYGGEGAPEGDPAAAGVEARQAGF